MNQHDLLVFLFGFIVGAFVFAWLTWSFLHARIEALEANLEHALHSRLDTLEALLSARWTAFQTAVAAHLHHGPTDVPIAPRPWQPTDGVTATDQLESPHPRIAMPPVPAATVTATSAAPQS